jgi:hypothetical protein
MPYLKIRESQRIDIYPVKGKYLHWNIKVIPIHGIKAWDGMEVLLHSGLEIGDQLHAASALLSGKHFRHTLNRTRGGSKSRSGGFRAQKYPLLLPGIEPRFLGCPDHSLVI